MDLTSQARRYATEAHARINHRRKYSLVPYDVHLKNVADIVASVTDDQEMIAAAWLHDVVEDTPASFLEIEKEFGMGVADLVSEVTDVSRSSDGNRATRKALDRAHLACASTRGKTIKLADLIDNCQDICRNDAVFAKTYLTEMASLLEVLVEGDGELYQQAARMTQENAQCLGLPLAVVSGMVRENPVPTGHLSPMSRMSALFLKTFAARDLARALPSIDLPVSESSVALLSQSSHAVFGLRRHGLIEGYALRDDPRCERPFRQNQIVGDDANFAEVILSLSQHSYCFVRIFDSVVGVITRADIDHPYMRMWLFGIITMAEMQIMPIIEKIWPGDAWKELISPGRLAKAEAMLEERQRRNQQSTLLACLQLSDKMQILVEHEPVRKTLGFTSKKIANKVCKEFESLRNNLAHAQDIVVHDFAQIARLAQRIDSMRGA
jgi:hypothetical protein